MASITIKLEFPPSSDREEIERRINRMIGIINFEPEGIGTWDLDHRERMNLLIPDEYLESVGSIQILDFDQSSGFDPAPDVEEYPVASFESDIDPEFI